MRYNEVVEYLYNLTKVNIKPYDMTKALGGNISKYTYRRDNNGNFSKEEMNTLIAYFKDKEFVPDLNQIETDEKKITLDYYPEIEISCGNGIEPLNGTKEQITISLNAIKGFSRGATYTVVNAVSDSMTPEIQPKDLLIVEHCQQIKDNHIYIFIYEGSLYCKYLSNNLGQIIVRSANELYPVRYIENTDEFYLIGEVKGHIRNYS